MKRVITFKKLDPNAVVPKRATSHSVGLDLTAIGFKSSEHTDPNIVYVRTGLAVEPPSGWFFELHARSSLHKSGWMLANSVGIIDPDYRGELIIALCPVSTATPTKIEPGTRIAQLVLKKSDLADMTIIESDVLTETDRGSGGFGSTT